MTQEEIIEEIKRNAALIINYLNENEALFTSLSTETAEYAEGIERLNRWSGEMRHHINGLKGYRFTMYEAKEVKKETRRPLSSDDVTDKSTPFFMKSVVLTGVLQAFPQREEIAAMLRRYGADVNMAISRKTDIVIMGEKAGPSKLKKIESLQDEGCEIHVMDEAELLDIIEQYGME